MLDRNGIPFQKKDELITTMARKSRELQNRLTKDQCKLAVDLLFETVIEGIENGQGTLLMDKLRIEILGRPERIRKNPGTGEKVVVPQDLMLVVTPGKSLTDAMENLPVDPYLIHRKVKEERSALRRERREQRDKRNK